MSTLFQWYGWFQYQLEQWNPPRPPVLLYRLCDLHEWTPIPSAPDPWEKLIDLLKIEWRYDAQLFLAPLALTIRAETSDTPWYVYEPAPLDATTFNQAVIRLTDLMQLSFGDSQTMSRSELVQRLEQVPLPQSWGPSVLGTAGITITMRRGAPLVFPAFTWLQLSLRPDEHGVKILFVVAISR